MVTFDDCDSFPCAIAANPAAWHDILYFSSIKMTPLTIRSTLIAVFSVVVLTQSATAQTLSEQLKAEGADALAKAARERGQAIRGAILFPLKKVDCTKCHGISQQLLGPDLSQIGKEVKDTYLVEALLDPSKEIKKGFETVTIATLAGKVIAGRIIEQNSEQIILRETADTNRLVTLAIDDIDEMKTSEKSSMPDGLVDQLASRQEFLDLVRYLMEIAAAGPRSGVAVHESHEAKRTLNPNLQGLALLDQYNCVACHASTNESIAFSASYGPNLNWSPGRISPTYIERFIADPTGVKQGTAMPHVMGALSPSARQHAAKTITHYLASLGSENFEFQMPDRIAAARGKEIFHNIGCVACHSPRDSQGKALLSSSSVPLGKLEEKYNLQGLVEFLENPHSARPAGRMPNMQTTHWEAIDLANYLLVGTKLPGSLHYTLFQGAMHEGFDRLDGKETQAGLADQFSLQPFGQLDEDYGVVFEGFLDVKNAGEYTFTVQCADACMVQIGETELIRIDPRPNSKTISGSAKINLSANKHSIRVSYLQLKGDQQLDVQLTGPNVEKGPIPASMLTSEKQPVERAEEFVVDKELANAGKRHFLQLGCANCHALEGTPPSRSFPTLAKLDREKGCLSNEQGQWPQFAISDDKRQLMKTALTELSNQLSDEQKIEFTMQRLNCIACHQRSGWGGITEERDDFFHSGNENLGPQGRIPPTLTNVGAKLQPQWMRDVLINGRAIRPYMKTRMPQYGVENVAHLVDLFQRVDEPDPIEFVEFKDVKEIRKLAVEMVGSNGMNCVACHTFQLKPAQTMPAVDLTEMAQRLHKNWFYRYMRDPQTLSPNTVMPSFWPGGRAIRQDFLDGDSDQQVEALWQYLLDGRQARIPRGLVQKPLEIVVDKEAKMLRRNYNGIGKRGIGVGLPNQVNFAFDAEQMRIAFIWKGKFVDPGGAWRGQGSGTARPAGTDVIPFARGPDLDDARQPWPVDDGRPPQHQFRGYDLDQQRRPTFHYQFDGVNVDDFPHDVRDPDSETTLIRREVTLSSERPRSNLNFRIATSDDIVEEQAGVFRIGKTLIVRVEKNHKAEIVDTLQGKQLNVPLDVNRDKTKLVIEYVW